MSNYDVIESYIIDFTTFNNRDDAIINNNKFVFTGNVVVGINYERIQVEKYNSYKILIKGLTGNIYYYYRNADGVENYIIFNKDGVYDIPVSYKQGTLLLQVMQVIILVIVVIILHKLLLHKL